MTTWRAFSLDFTQAVEAQLTGLHGRTMLGLGSLLQPRDGLHCPAVILLIEERSAQDLVLLLHGDEVLNDQMPARRTVHIYRIHKWMLQTFARCLASNI